MLRHAESHRSDRIAERVGQPQLVAPSGRKASPREGRHANGLGSPTRCRVPQHPNTLHRRDEVHASGRDVQNADPLSRTDYTRFPFASDIRFIPDNGLRT
jgi:hypothetical protein